MMRMNVTKEFCNRGNNSKQLAVVYNSLSLRSRSERRVPSPFIRSRLPRRRRLLPSLKIIHLLLLTCFRFDRAPTGSVLFACFLFVPFPPPPSRPIFVLPSCPASKRAYPASPPAFSSLLLIANVRYCHSSPPATESACVFPRDCPSAYSDKYELSQLWLRLKYRLHALHQAACHPSTQGCQARMRQRSPACYQCDHGFL